MFPSSSLSLIRFPVLLPGPESSLRDKDLHGSDVQLRRAGTVAPTPILRQQKTYGINSLFPTKLSRPQ